MTSMLRPEEDYFQLAVEREILRGVAHRPMQTPPCGLIVLAYGLNGDRVCVNRTFVTTARRWAEKGLACYRFDYRGCGLSDGEFWRSSMGGRAKDLEAVLRFAQYEYPLLPIVVTGFSDGCRVAMTINPEPNISGWLLWSPVLIPPAPPVDSNNARAPHTILCGWQRHPTVPVVVQPLNGLWLAHSYYGRRRDLQTTHHAHTPICVVHGANDRSTDASVALLRDTNSTIREVEIPGAHHLFTERGASEELYAQSTRWLSSVLCLNCP